RDFLAHLVGGKQSAFSGLGALRNFNLDHFHLRKAGFFTEGVLIETAIGMAATEIAGAQLPNQVPALKVVGADAALAGVVIKATLFGAEIERRDRGFRKRAVAHGGNIK